MTLLLKKTLPKNALIKSALLCMILANVVLPVFAVTPEDSQLEDLTKPILLEDSTNLPTSEKKLSVPNDPALNVITTANIQGQNLTLPLGLLNKINEAGINPANVSILVKPLPPKADKTPALLLNHQPHALRIPASTQKLIPTFIALDTLGADFTWHTQIFQKGFIISNTLHGDIVIQGSGDPALSHERLYAMLGELAKYGIKHIDGDILLDNSIFDNVNFNPSAFDGQGLKAYNAPPNGLLINFGTLQVDFIPSGKLPLLPPLIATNSATGLTAPLTTATSGNEAENMESLPPSPAAFIPNPAANSVAVRLLPPMADYPAPTILPASLSDCGKTPPAKPSVSKDSLSFSGQVTASCGKQSWWFTFPDSNSLVSKAIKGTWLQYDPTFAGQVRFIKAKDRQRPSNLQTVSLPLPIVSYPSFPLSRQIWDINHFSNNVMTEQVTLSLPIYAGGEKRQRLSDSFWLYPKLVANPFTQYQAPDDEPRLRAMPRLPS